MALRDDYPLSRASGEWGANSRAVPRIEERARPIAVAGRGHDALAHPPLPQQADGDHVVPARQETLGAVDGVDDPGAVGAAVDAEVEPGDQFGFADRLAQDCASSDRTCSRCSAADQLQELLARFFGHDGVLRIVRLQGAADDGLRAVVGDGDRLGLRAAGFGAGDQVLLLHEAAKLGGIARGGEYRLHIASSDLSELHTMIDRAPELSKRRMWERDDEAGHKI